MIISQRQGEIISKDGFQIIFSVNLLEIAHIYSYNAVALSL